MFESGHLHLHHLSFPGLPDGQEFSIDVHYEVRSDAQEGQMLHMFMKGAVDGKAFEETFELHRDDAFNFATKISRIAERHGRQPHFGSVFVDHKDFDAMFADIRRLLDLKPGEPMNLDHLGQDGL